MGLQARLSDAKENAVKLNYLGEESEGDQRGGSALGARPDWDALETMMSPLFHWIL